MGTGTRMPDWLEPMAATLTQDPPSPGGFGEAGRNGGDWLFERKFDGIRLLAYKRGEDVRLYSRNRLPQHLPPIADAIARLSVDEVILDGEMTWGPPPPDGYGGASLHGEPGKPPTTRHPPPTIEGRYHLFDILWLNGRSLTSLPLEDRQRLLRELPLTPPLRRVELLDDHDPWDRARREGWEGVIAKRRGSPYEHRRSKLWLKMKCEASQEFVVGGFTDPQGSRVGLGALLVGYYDQSDLVFAGRLGTGFDTRLLLDLRHRLDAIEIPTTPFSRSVGLPRLRAHWVKPEVVVQVAFLEWTGHGKLRHPRLLGVRFDRNARDVVRE